MKIKFSLFNFDYDDENKNKKMEINKKSSKIEEILKAFFITLVTGLIIKFVFGL